MPNIKHADLRSVKKLGGSGTILGLIAWTLLQTHFLTWLSSGGWDIFARGRISELRGWSYIDLFFEVFVLLLSLTSLVLLLLAVKRLSDEAKRSKVFKDFFIGVILQIAGWLWLALLGALFGKLLSSEGSFREFTSEFYLGPIFFASLSCWILQVAGATLIRVSYRSISEITSEDKFSLAGTLIFWGAVLLIVLGLGDIAIVVGKTLVAVALFSLPNTLEIETAPEGPI